MPLVWGSSGGISDGGFGSSWPGSSDSSVLKKLLVR